MKREDMKINRGLTLVSLVVTIVILLILAGVSISLVLGNNGILEQATTMDEQYSQKEVLESLNFIVSEKYIDAYNKASADGDITDLSNYYSLEKVINYLLGISGGADGTDTTNVDGTPVIELLDGTSDCYFVILSKLDSNITKYGKGSNTAGATDIFYLKLDDSGTTYMLIYVNSDGDEVEVGTLDIDSAI